MSIVETASYSWPQVQYQWSSDPWGMFTVIISRDSTLAHDLTESLYITSGVQNCITVCNIPGKGPVICNILSCCAENQVSQSAHSAVLVIPCQVFKFQHSLVYLSPCRPTIYMWFLRTRSSEANRENTTVSDMSLVQQLNSRQYFCVIIFKRKKNS